MNLNQASKDSRAFPGFEADFPKGVVTSKGGSAGASPYQLHANEMELPNRRKPSQGVRIDFHHPTIVFVTVCTKNRMRWLACDEAHKLLLEIWRNNDAWMVGNYVLMPDHVHLFAAPRDLQFTVDRWITFWKSRFSKLHSHSNWIWQSRAFHHRLRNDENYFHKWTYVQENPVRAGLAKQVGEWPYLGTVHNLRW